MLGTGSFSSQSDPMITQKFYSDDCPPAASCGNQVALLPQGPAMQPAAGVPQSPWVIEQSVQMTGYWVWSYFDLRLARVSFCIQWVQGGF